MPKTLSLLFLAALAAPATPLALQADVWIPFNAQPLMGNAASPDITKANDRYTLTASVTDLDQFTNNLDPNMTAKLAGDEGDVSVYTNISSNILPTNTSFDSSSGKREATWVIKNNSYLLDKGDIGYVVYNFKGVDNVADTRRHDPDTAVSQCPVALKYVSPPAGPPH